MCYFFFFKQKTAYEMRISDWSSDVCSSDLEELIGEKWLDGPIYRDYLKPLDVRYLLGADFYTPDGIECRLRITRPHGAPPFGADERAMVRFVLPHLKRSLRQPVREESLECERQLLAGTVNRMRSAEHTSELQQQMSQ